MENKSSVQLDTIPKSQVLLLIYLSQCLNAVELCFNALRLHKKFHKTPFLSILVFWLITTLLLKLLQNYLVSLGFGSLLLNTATVVIKGR